MPGDLTVGSVHHPSASNRISMRNWGEKKKKRFQEFVLEFHSNYDAVKFACNKIRRK
jgi:hypothetical protein